VILPFSGEAFFGDAEKVSTAPQCEHNEGQEQEAATPEDGRHEACTALRCEPSLRPRLEQDLQGQVCRATALEQLDRGVEIDVVPHRKPTCCSRLVPGTLELFRTPAFDALDLRLID
jgi:hypothetical protein